MTLTRFVPTQEELFDYYMANQPDDVSYTKHFRRYQGWLKTNLKDIVRLALAFDADLVKLGRFSKAPVEGYNAKPLSRLQAMRYCHEVGDFFGWRGNGQFILLDYDSETLTPELERLVLSGQFAIITPNGWCLPCREPIHLDLWSEIERKLPGFAPSEATRAAREQWRVKDLERLSVEHGFTDDEREEFGTSRFILGNARRGRSYACLPGAISCRFQSALTGLRKPPGRQHFGFGHESEGPCVGNPAGKGHFTLYEETESDGVVLQKKRHDLAPLPCKICVHDWRMRMLYKRDQSYFTGFVPSSVTILPFETVARAALRM